MKNIYLFLIIVFAGFQAKAQCLNLTKYQFPGWDNQILISAISGTSVSESAFYENQNLYLYFGVVNWGTCNTPRSFTVRLFLDGVEKYFTNVSSLQANYAQPFNDIAITGSLSVGSHTIQIDIDYPSLISETNETDNTFTRTFTVQQGACVSTPIGTIWNGNRTFNTEHYLADNFRIKDKCQTSILTIRHWNSTTTTGYPLEIESPTNSWNSTGNQQWGGSTMWTAKSSYKYFSDVHSRNSYDGANGLLNGFIHGVFTGGETNSATMSSTGGIMKIGLGSSGTLTNSYGTLDIVGHEYAHAVTGSSAQLAYQYEPGALNESFSDIFGECIENYTLGSNDWLIGANRDAGAMRSMINPNRYSQPDTYLGTNWVAQNCPSPTTANDQCGVHTNSGVQNYWFYLLSQGGTGTNDINNAFNVPALGIAKARDIAFKTLTIYLFNQPNATYATARTASIQAAQDTYPGNSPEVSAVMNAWCAVGLGVVPGAVSVAGGGTFCNSTIITASSVMGANVYYQGTNSNGTATSTPSTSQTITSSGTYYFRAQNGCGWGASVGVAVTINSGPAAVSVPGGGTFCNSVILNATGGAGGSIYYQGTNSNGTSTANPTSSFTVNASGTYYFRAGNLCGWGPSGSVTVTVVPEPGAVTLSGGGTFCNSTTITASGGAGGTIYWQETTAGGSSTVTPSTSQVVTSSGTYYFRVRNASCGWGPQGSATVTINTIPAAANVSGAGTFCNSTTIAASGGSGGTVYWQGTTSGGTSTSTQSSSQTINASGTYYFRSYNASCGWGSQGSATVAISILPAVVSVSGSGTFCNSTTITASEGSGGSIYWQNTTNGGTSTASQSSSQTINASGTYYFRSYNASCGWGSQGSASVVIIPNVLPLSGTATSGDQKAVQTISSNQTIPTGAIVNYQAGKSISLQGTFNAQTGSVFKAEIKTCI